MIQLQSARGLNVNESSLRLNRLRAALNIYLYQNYKTTPRNIDIVLKQKFLYYLSLTLIKEMCRCIRRQFDILQFFYAVQLLQNLR